MKFAPLVGLALAVAWPWSAVQAQASSPTPAASGAVDPGAQRIDDIFTKPHLAPDAFAPSFAEKMPPSRVEGIAKQLKVVLGDFKEAKKTNQPNQPPFDATWERYVASFTKGTEDVYIHFDSAGKVDGLIFRELHPL